MSEKKTFVDAMGLRPTVISNATSFSGSFVEDYSVVVNDDHTTTPEVVQMCKLADAVDSYHDQVGVVAIKRAIASGQASPDVFRDHGSKGVAIVPPGSGDPVNAYQNLRTLEKTVKKQTDFISSLGLDPKQSYTIEELREHFEKIYFKPGEGGKIE